MNWIVLLTPLLAAGLITFLLAPLKRMSVLVSVLACAVSFAASLAIVTAPEDVTFTVWTWIEMPGLTVTIGAMADPLARVMLLVVTGVGLLIHIFAYGYMKEDPGLSRFFAKLSFFMFSMLGIVLADNLVMMFIFWELVGLSSYLLIGFWFQRPAAADACKKAFIVNRIGDFGFLVGILAVWGLFGGVSFMELPGVVGEIVEGYPEVVELSLLHIAAIGLFMGCVGKSAQVPLHVWLPDAMEGPTPVSALIHAATMVAAGVYMLCRVFFIIGLSQVAMHLILVIGVVTAVMAALIALQQNDIKRILAYSTLSQLGYMVAAVGMKATDAAMFHLTTHAFFKALLFLGAGSVIHALHHEQDMWKMGGLRKRMPYTFWTFALGALALAGFPLLSGFWSKEAILLAAWNHNPVVFALLLFTAALTAFYMTRLFVVAFLGEARSGAAEHAHESPMVMTMPLVLLALLAVFGGLLPVASYINPSGSHGPGGTIVMALSIGAFILAAGLGWYCYGAAREERISIMVLREKFYSDEIYELFVVQVQQALARGLYWLDTWLLGGLLVRGSAAGATLTGEVLRLLQGGNLQAYIVLFVLGAGFVAWWMLVRLAG